MRNINKPSVVAFVCMLFLAAASGCTKGPRGLIEQHEAVSPFETYRDVPGVSHDDIKAVEAILAKTGSFSYGMTPASEAFYNKNGEVRGFSVLMTDWLTKLFGIPFNLTIYEWDDLHEGLNAKEIDFVGNLAISEERRQRYFITDAIARRNIKYMWLMNNPPLAEIATVRPLRYAFLNGATTFDFVSPHISGEYEYVFANDYHDAYEMLKNKKIDAFIGEGPNEAAFDQYGDVVSQNFFPPLSSPIALMTAKPELEPIISVVQKALEHGGALYLAKLYSIGEHEYLRHKLSTLLTEEEHAYIQNNPVVAVAMEFANYPVNFYNVHEKQWQGIALDVLSEVEGLTGLRFEYTSNKTATRSDLLNMLETGKVPMITELMLPDERKGNVLWSNVAFMEDCPALISKSEYRNIPINEIIHVKVGMVADGAYAELFRKWFPNHAYMTEYANLLDAFDALDRGKINVVMTSQIRLLMMTHYLGRTNFKSNFVFEYPFSSKFGFNKNEAVLRSIIDKALRLMDTEAISGEWLRKNYDYRAKMAEAQLPWLIGTAAMLLCILGMLCIMVYRQRSEGSRLEILVAQRTEEAKNASEAKSEFLAKMSHEMRTPLNAVIGFSEMTLGFDEAKGEIAANLEKIYSSGIILLSIINDLLDISKIEAGKLELIPVEYDVPSLIHDTAALNSVNIASKPILFVLEVDENLPHRLLGDELRVKQIFNNLLSNAFKYTKKGKVTWSISGEHKGGNFFLVSRVSDTGIGIRQEDFTTLFTEYFQGDTKMNRNIEGTGLGLPIASRMAKLMGGALDVESKYGVGSTFTVRVLQKRVTDEPLGAEVAFNLAHMRYSQNKLARNANLVRLKIPYARVLVVDDVQTNLDVVRGILKPYEIQVDCVTSGQQAIDAMQNEGVRYSAIFMDHMMPEMDGIETVQRIRTLGTEYTQKIPIIALTANAMAGNEEMFLQSGFQAFLSKPIDIMRLDVVIRHWLRDKSQETIAQTEHSSSSDIADLNFLPSWSIEGLDKAKALEQFGGSEKTYLIVLQSYVDHTPGLLDKIRTCSEAQLQDYVILVHGIKSTSYGIYADTVGKQAEMLEKAARQGNFQHITEHNAEFIKSAEELIDRINTVLRKIKSEG